MSAAHCNPDHFEKSLRSGALEFSVDRVVAGFPRNGES